VTHRPDHAGRRAASLLGETLLWTAAIAGAACIVLVIAAHTMGISLILFSTGSMAPTIPAGSAALVQRAPAAEVEVGDIMTVDRSEQLPITHRVTSVSPGATPEERIITMRGDANEQDDPHPYAVASVRRVLGSVPGLAALIASLGDPRALGAITIGASLLVGWAFWPRRARPADALEAAASTAAASERAS
jgi:signal peptidase